MLPPIWIMAFTSILANKFENGVKCLVINCHGKYGYGTNRFGNKRLIDTGGFGLRLGQGIYLADTEKFSQLKGLVKCIVITACGVAQVTNDGKNTGNGAYFCSQIARAANAYVVAPIILQAPAHYKLSKNHTDNFEGEVVRYNPSGALDDSRFLGRKLIHDIF